MVLTFAALIRTVLLGRARNFATKEQKLCTSVGDVQGRTSYGMYQRAFERVKVSLNLFTLIEKDHLDDWSPEENCCQ